MHQFSKIHTVQSFPQCYHPANPGVYAAVHLRITFLCDTLRHCIIWPRRLGGGERNVLTFNGQYLLEEHDWSGRDSRESNDNTLPRNVSIWSPFQTVYLFWTMDMELYLIFQSPGHGKMNRVFNERNLGYYVSKIINPLWQSRKNTCTIQGVTEGMCETSGECSLC